MKFTVTDIQRAMESTDYWQVKDSKEAKIINAAESKGYIKRLSHTQVEWSQEGLKRAKNELNHLGNLYHSVAMYHYGSEQVFHRLNRSAVYSEGVMSFLDMATCHWLYDIIESEVYNRVCSLDMDTYYFKIRVGDKKADLLLENYKNEVFWSKHIPFTDLLPGSMQLIIGHHGQQMVTCLPSEN